MGKNRTIAERERFISVESPSSYCPELMKEVEKLGGDGLPTDSEDYAWDGGCIDGVPRLSHAEIEAFRNSDLGEKSALEQILARIIAEHPDAKFPKCENLKNKSCEQYRLEQAMKYLTGYKPKTGVKENDEDNLEAIARKYHKAALELQHEEDYINLLMASVVRPSVGIDDLTKEEISLIVRRTREDFYANFQRLMFKITDHDSEEQFERRACIQRIGDDLIKLIKTSRPEPVAYHSSDKIALNTPPD